MSFEYITRPLQGNTRYTSQPSYRGIRREAEVLAALAQATGVSESDIATVLLKLGEYVVDESMNGYKIAPLRGYLGFGATCGGSQPNPDFVPSFENLAVGIRLRLGKDARARAERVFSAVNVGRHDIVLPEVVRVTDTHTNRNCCYTPGKAIMIDLATNNGTMDTSTNAQGIFFKSGTGVMTRAVDYPYNRGTMIICTVPATLTGEQELCVKMEIYGSVRLGVYARPLSPSSSVGEESPTVGRSRAAKPGGKDVALQG